MRVINYRKGKVCEAVIWLNDFDIKPDKLLL